LATSRHREAEPIEYLRTERVRHALKVGPAGLNNGERLALLSDPVALARLHEQVWSEGHAEWLAAWRDSIKADPHAPLLPLQPLSSQAQPA
jgi:membrane glycosyltransferase